VLLAQALIAALQLADWQLVQAEPVGALEQVGQFSSTQIVAAV